MFARITTLIVAGFLLQPGVGFRITGDVSMGAQEPVRAVVRNSSVLLATHQRDGNGSPSRVSMLSVAGKPIWQRELTGKIYRLVVAGDRAFLWVASGQSDELQVIALRDGASFRRYPIDTEDDIVAVSADGRAIATYKDSSESGPSNQIQIRALDSDRVWGLLTEGATTRVALVDGTSVFVGRLDGSVDAYHDHAKIWTKAFAAQGAVNEIQVARDGRTVLVGLRGGRTVILDGTDGRELLTLDPNDPTASLQALGVADDIASDKQKRQRNNKPVFTDSEIARRLKLYLDEDGRVMAFDASRDKLPVAQEFDPRRSERTKNGDAEQIWSVLAGSGYVNPEVDAIGFAGGPRLLMSPDRRVAAVVFEQHLVILQGRR